MISGKLKQALDDNQIKYVTILHSPAYTALETSHVTHISGKEMAKTVMVSIDGEMAMAVLAANKKLDLAALKRLTDAGHIDLATEEEFSRKFSDCEIGAMPPLGNLYGMPVYVDQPLSEDLEIVFNAGTHKELIKLAYKDYEQLVKPTVARLSE